MKLARTRVRGGWLAAALLSVAAAALDAHHSLVAFDTETLLWVEGTVVRFDPVNPHSFIYLDGAAADGTVQRWALEGPGATSFGRRGIAPDLIRPGDTLRACGFALKEDRQGPRGIEGRVLVAATLALPSGEGRIWSDYGQAHRCIAADSRTAYRR